jgi:hypothetical protein
MFSAAGVRHGTFARRSDQHRLSQAHLQNRTRRCAGHGQAGGATTFRGHERLFTIDAWDMATTDDARRFAFLFPVARTRAEFAPERFAMSLGQRTSR